MWLHRHSLSERAKFAHWLASRRQRAPWHGPRCVHLLCIQRSPARACQDRARAPACSTGLRSRHGVPTPCVCEARCVCSATASPLRRTPRRRALAECLSSGLVEHGPCINVALAAAGAKVERHLVWSSCFTVVPWTEHDRPPDGERVPRMNAAWRRLGDATAGGYASSSSSWSGSSSASASMRSNWSAA